MDKKAMKQAYKEAKRSMGVYAIRHSQTHKIFLGFTTDLPARFNRHKAELRFGSHRNRELQGLWNSFSESDFEFEILDVLDHEENSRASAYEELQLLAEMWKKKLEEAGNFIVCL